MRRYARQGYISRRHMESLHNATNNRSLADTSPITAVLAYPVRFQVHLKLLRDC